MADAGEIWLHALSGLGNNIADSMQQYHKEHEAYDKQNQFATALSRLGVNAQGSITPIDPNNKDKTIQPIIDPKALEMFQTNNATQRAKATGALEALNRMGMSVAAQTVGPMRQQQLTAATQANQRYPVTVNGNTYPATAGQAIQSNFEQQRIDEAAKPRGLSQMQLFRQQEAKDKAFQAKIQASPEYQFQKKYSVLPSQVLRPDVLDPRKQGYQYFDSAGKPLDTKPDEYGVLRPTGGLQAGAYWTPTSQVFRENKIDRNQGGVKTTQFAPNPSGELVNIGGQRIPYSDIQGIANRHDELLKQAQFALKQGAPPQAIGKQWSALGYDPTEIFGQQ